MKPPVTTWHPPASSVAPRRNPYLTNDPWVETHGYPRWSLRDRKIAAANGRIMDSCGGGSVTGKSPHHGFTRWRLRDREITDANGRRAGPPVAAPQPDSWSRSDLMTVAVGFNPRVTGSTTIRVAARRNEINPTNNAHHSESGVSSTSRGIPPGMFSSDDVRAGFGCNGPRPKHLICSR